MKIKAVVPIKLNNERFPNKNLELLDGRPLCEHLLGTLSEIEGLETFVYCSEERIKEYLPKGVGFVQRSTELDRFSVKRQQIVKSMIQDVEADVYVYAHVTNPLLKKESIQAAVDAIVKEGCDSAIGVIKHQKYIWYKGEALNFSTQDLLRTQDIEPVYMEMGLYVFKRQVAMLNGSVYGENMKLIPVSEIEAVDIDYKEDLDFANLILANQRGGIHG